MASKYCGKNIAFAAGQSKSSARHAVNSGLDILFSALLFSFRDSRVTPREKKNQIIVRKVSYVLAGKSASRFAAVSDKSTSWGTLCVD